MKHKTSYKNTDALTELPAPTRIVSARFSCLQVETTVTSTAALLIHPLHETNKTSKNSEFTLRLLLLFFIYAVAVLLYQDQPWTIIIRCSVFIKN